VAHRVEALADREAGFKPSGAPPYRSLIPLPEILGEALGVGAGSKSVQEEYARLLSALGNEFNILLDVPVGDIERVASPMAAEAVRRVRLGLVTIKPGYDGEYGRVKIFEERERRELKGQGRLL
jgi:PHP family Zn ribbon phosphoesterase